MLNYQQITNKESKLKKQNILLLSLATFILGGCSGSPRVETSMLKGYKKSMYSIPTKDKSNYFRYKPIIGTTQPDTKVMINMGKFAKIWIQSYINKNRTFIASHDIIVMVKEPGYISGEDLPSAMNRAQEKTYGANTFTFRSTDLFTNSNMPTNNVTDEEIKSFMNNYEREKRTLKLIPSKRKLLNKYNNTVLLYIKDHKEKLRMIRKKLNTKIKTLKAHNNTLNQQIKALSSELKNNQTLSKKDKLLINAQDKRLNNDNKMLKIRLNQLEKQQGHISQLLSEIPK